MTQTRTLPHGKEVPTINSKCPAHSAHTTQPDSWHDVNVNSHIKDVAEYSIFNLGCFYSRSLSCSPYLHVRHFFLLSSVLIGQELQPAGSDLLVLFLHSIISLSCPSLNPRLLHWDAATGLWSTTKETDLKQFLSIISFDVEVTRTQILLPSGTMDAPCPRSTKDKAQNSSGGFKISWWVFFFHTITLITGELLF